jgi:hypothetical protein
MAGASMAGAFPSPFASLPGSVPAPGYPGAPAYGGPGPAQGAAPGGGPWNGSHVLFARGEDPSAQSPLTYREVAYCVPEGTPEPEAERVLRQHLQALVAQLAPAPPGKYVALAAFDVRFSGRPPKPPLVTLTWKDWHGPEPKVAYPAQQRALHGSMAGASMAGAFPSPFASLPGAPPSAPSPLSPWPPPPATPAPPMAPAAEVRSGAATPRSPRDPASGGGGNGGASSDGWPPASPERNASPPEFLASPAVMGVRAARHEADAGARAPGAGAEGASHGSEGHIPLLTGEFMMADESTPMRGPGSLSPEAFPEDQQPTRVQLAPTLDPEVAAALGLSAPAAGAAPARPASATDLLGRLFEAMPALESMATEREGAEFVLDLLARTVPSRVMFCHVYDEARREFVVAAARTPSAGGAPLGARTPEGDPSLAAALWRPGALVVPDAGGDPHFGGGRWAAAGEAVRSAAAAAARSGGRVLGLIEVANPSGGGRFGEAEARALEYVAEQLGAFLGRSGAAAPPGGGR